MKVKDYSAKSKSDSDAAAKLEQAQKTISRLEKKLEGERRKVEALEQKLSSERQEKQKIEIELTKLKTSSKSPKSPQPAPNEASNAPVEMGFISFSQEETKQES